MASVSLSVNDGDSNHCQCKGCLSMDARNAFRYQNEPNLSDRYFRFYNKVIKRVNKKNPEAQVAVLAYGPTGKPPVETKINNNVIVFITTGYNPRQFEKAGGKSSLYQYHIDYAYPTIRHCPQMLKAYFK
ncbi:MAG: DUF4838 domain-containing protein, partial [Planctomycetota bacterium]